MAKKKTGEKATNAPSKAVWITPEEVKLFELLLAVKEKAGDGVLFKMSTFNSIAPKLNPPASGPPKTGKMCKNKYTKQKKLWDEVIKICGNSGWVWDHEKGANVTPEKLGVWNAWLAENPDSLPFKNKGFIHFEVFDKLIPMATHIPRGQNVFRPGQATPGNDSDGSSSESSVPSPTGSPDWDYCRLEQSMDESPLEDRAQGGRDGAEDGGGDDNGEDEGEDNRGEGEGEGTGKEQQAVAPAAEERTGRKRGASETPLPGSDLDKRTRAITSVSSTQRKSSTTPAPKHSATPRRTDFKERAAVALEKFGDRLASFDRTFDRVMSGPSPQPTLPPPRPKTPPRSNDTIDAILLKTPQRNAAAIHRALKLEKPWLTDAQMVSFAQKLSTDSAYVINYLAMPMDNNSLRKRTVLQGLGIPAPDVHDWDSDGPIVPMPPVPDTFEQLSMGYSGSTSWA